MQWRPCEDDEGEGQRRPLTRPEGSGKSSGVKHPRPALHWIYDTTVRGLWLSGVSSRPELSLSFSRHRQPAPLGSCSLSVSWDPPT